MQVLTFQNVAAGRNRDRVAAFQIQGDADYGDVDRDAVAVVVGDPGHLHPGGRHRHRVELSPSGAVTVPPVFPEESGSLSLDAGLKKLRLYRNLKACQISTTTEDRIVQALCNSPISS